MTALNAKTKKQIEKQLLAQREEMLTSVRAEVARSEDQSFAAIAGEVPDVGDAATAALLTDFENEIARRHGEAMREIEEALHRLNDPYFGICTDCGDDIGVERLKASPTATRCVTCQGQREKTYAHGSIPSL